MPLSSPPYPETIYLFIDGAYLRERYRDALKEFFGEEGNLDFSYVRDSLQANRVFYYDCLYDQKKTNENDVEFHARVNQQTAFFDEVQSLQNYHVRLGSLTGKEPRPRQKKVDVSLTVEMLDHAFRKNMDKVILIAGDLDFAPLVQSVVRLGTHVQVLYDLRSAARELYTSADIGQAMNIFTYWGWSTRAFQNAHQVPGLVTNANHQGVNAGYKLLRLGTLKGRDVELWKDEQQYYMFLKKTNDAQSLQMHFHDRGFLESFFNKTYGEPEWDSNE